MLHAADCMSCWMTLETDQMRSSSQACAWRRHRSIALRVKLIRCLQHRHTALRMIMIMPTAAFRIQCDTTQHAYARHMSTGTHAHHVALSELKRTVPGAERGQERFMPI